MLVVDFGEDGRSEGKSCGWAVMMRECGDGMRDEGGRVSEASVRLTGTRKQEQDKPSKVSKNGKF